MSPHPEALVPASASKPSPPPPFLVGPSSSSARPKHWTTKKKEKGRFAKKIREKLVLDTLEEDPRETWEDSIVYATKAASRRTIKGKSGTPRGTAGNMGKVKKVPGVPPKQRGQVGTDKVKKPSVGRRQSLMMSEEEKGSPLAGNLEGFAMGRGGEEGETVSEEEKEEEEEEMFSPKPSEGTARGEENGVSGTTACTEDDY